MDKHKQVFIIAAGALSLLATCYLVYRFFVIRKIKMRDKEIIEKNNNADKVHNQGIKVIFNPNENEQELVHENNHRQYEEDIDEQNQNSAIETEQSYDQFLEEQNVDNNEEFDDLNNPIVEQYSKTEINSGIQEINEENVQKIQEPPKTNRLDKKNLDIPKTNLMGKKNQEMAKTNLMGKKNQEPSTNLMAKRNQKNVMEKKKQDIPATSFMGKKSQAKPAIPGTHLMNKKNQEIPQTNAMNKRGQEIPGTKKISKKKEMTENNDAMKKLPEKKVKNEFIDMLGTSFASRYVAFHGDQYSNERTKEKMTEGHIPASLEHEKVNQAQPTTSKRNLFSSLFQQINQGSQNIRRLRKTGGTPKDRAKATPEETPNLNKVQSPQMEIFNGVMDRISQARNYFMNDNISEESENENIDESAEEWDGQ